MSPPRPHHPTAKEKPQTETYTDANTRACATSTSARLGTYSVGASVIGAIMFLIGLPLVTAFFLALGLGISWVAVDPLGPVFDDKFYCNRLDMAFRDLDGAIAEGRLAQLHARGRQVLAALGDEQPEWFARFVDEFEDKAAVSSENVRAGELFGDEGQLPSYLAHWVETSKAGIGDIGYAVA